jgi:glyoxylase-like metal-dependent hydrolase (beta-lactamase superfamily II)
MASAEVTIKTDKVAGNVYMLTGRGGNIGVSAGEDGVVMIDDQFARLAPKILAAVRKLGKGDPRFLINTHWHGDHTGGNPEIGKLAKIIAHDNVRKRLLAGAKVRGRVIEPMGKPGLPVLTFRESISLHFNGEEIRIVHFPTGHTDGDSIVFFTKSNVVHMGDHMFNGRFPYVDMSSGGNPVSYAANVGKVLAQIADDTKLIPGHGALASKADLAAFHAMLNETIGIVRKAKAAGQTLEQIKKVGLPAKYESWGKGFITAERWIETLYNGIQ